MEYTVQKLGQLAGISTRTLRYYDEVGLLKPSRINTSGYRIYGQLEVDQLQQILFYRELGVGLEEIKVLTSSPAYDANRALLLHRQKLLEKREKLDLLITNIEQTLAQRKGTISMSDKQKFEGFKQKLIDNNEKNYGNEIRTKYGEDQVDKANQKVKGMTEQQYSEVEQMALDIHSALAAAFATGDPAGKLAQAAADLHKQWLCHYWDSYSKEAHVGLAQLYVEDERFKAYYDKDQPGTAEFLRDAISIYTGHQNS